MRRNAICTSAIAAVALCVTAVPAGAAPRVLKVPVPAAGDLTVANVTFKVKGARLGALPAPRVANRRALGAPLTVVGGLKKIGASTVLATVVIVRRQTGLAGASRVDVALRLPRRVRFARFARRQIAKSVIAGGKRPPYCSSLPRSYRHVASSPLLGRALPGFSARQVAEYGSSVGCRTFARQEAFVGSFRGEGADPGGATGGGRDPSGREGAAGGETSEETDPGCTPAEDEPADESSICLGEEDYTGPGISPTLQGAGTVTRGTDPRTFSYSISFNEPVLGFRITGGGYIRCPTATYAAWYSECAQDSVRPGYNLTCDVPPGSLVTDFVCSVSSPDGPTPPGSEIPAGSVITGTYTSESTAPVPSGSSVGLVGFDVAGRESNPASIPVS